jgi:hypothetical protein
MEVEMNRENQERYQVALILGLKNDSNSMVGSAGRWRVRKYRQREFFAASKNEVDLEVDWVKTVAGWQAIDSAVQLSCHNGDPLI